MPNRCQPYPGSIYCNFLINLFQEPWTVHHSMKLAQQLIVGNELVVKYTQWKTSYRAAGGEDELWSKARIIRLIFIFKMIIFQFGQFSNLPIRWFVLVFIQTVTYVNLLHINLFTKLVEWHLLRVSDLLHLDGQDLPFH